MGKSSAGRSGVVSEQDPPLVVQNRPVVVRSRMRRAILAVCLLGVVAAIAICLFVLDGFAARLATGSAAGGSSSAALADCQERFPEWTEEWLQGELTAIRDAKGGDAEGVAAPWRTPETFPSAALAWSGIVPECGSTMVVDVDDSVWASRMDVTEATRTQFDAMSNLLSAMGYSLTFDEVPHDLLQVGGIEPESESPEEGLSDADSGAGDDQTAARWYREFANADGVIWMAFFPADPAADEPAGELVIGYESVD
jgi:hypothetical protein